MAELRQIKNNTFVIEEEGKIIANIVYAKAKVDGHSVIIFGPVSVLPEYQGRGYGKTAAKLILDKMQAEGKFRKVGLCYVEGNDAAKAMYEGLGFYHTGEADEDEIVMECDLCQI